jgi:hypothetical protein
MAYLHWAMCHNIKSSKHVIKCPKLFQNNNNNNNKILNIGTRDNTSFACNSDQNSYILIACDNMYTTKSKDEFIFDDFFIYPIPLVVCD